MIGENRLTRRTKVVLKDCGQAPVGLPGNRGSAEATKRTGVGEIFEAVVVWEGGRTSKEMKEHLLDRLWGCSEEVIQEAGGRVSTTTHTDPAWTTKDYKALMDRTVSHARRRDESQRGCGEELERRKRASRLRRTHKNRFDSAPGHQGEQAAGGHPAGPWHRVDTTTSLLPYSTAFVSMGFATGGALTEGAGWL